MNDDRPRYTELAFPPYSYVPGHMPHPVSDPAGHMFGQTHQPAKPLQPQNWQVSAEYRYGADLFNHGYYWEAHEAWESLWHAAGRKGHVADFLKGLIKLAAAGVKAREGNPRGVRRHADRAKVLLSGDSGDSGYDSDADSDAEFCGLNLEQLLAMADTLSRTANSYNQPCPQLRLEAVMMLNGA